MPCPLRVIVIAVSVVVAVTLALVALLSGDDDAAGAGKWQEGALPDGSSGEATDERGSFWKALDFANGKYLYRQYLRLRRSINGVGPAASSSLPPASSAARKKQKTQ